MSDTRQLLAALDYGTACAELCRTHRVPEDWLHDGADPRALAERALGEGANAEPEELRRLAAFALAVLRVGAAAPPTALVSGVADLERLRHAAPAAAADEQTLELLTTISGMCHRINNPLTSLLGRTQILKIKQETDPEALMSALSVIEESSRRVAALVQELGQLVGQARESKLSR